MTDDWDPRKSKALQESLDELHDIRAKLWQEEKGLTLDQRVAKTRRESQAIIDKCGLPVLPPEPNERRNFHELMRLLRPLRRQKEPQ